MSLAKVVGAVQWIVGVAATTCVVLLFTLGAADTPAVSQYQAGPGTDPAVLARGEEVYASACRACHGSDGQGGTGPRLAGTVVASYPDVAGEIAVVVAGGNGMPAFATRLDADEIDAVVAFTREALGVAG